MPESHGMPAKPGGPRLQSFSPYYYEKDVAFIH